MYQMPPSSAKPPQNSFIQRFKASTQKYSTGNRVYNGFSPSPHAGGGIDKSGYQERDNIANATRKNFIQQLAKIGI